MTSENRDLAWLIHPIPLNDFLDGIWGRSFHHFERRAPSFYQELCTADELEAYLDIARVPASSVRLISVADELPLTQFRFADGELDVVSIRNAFDRGYSIVLNALDRYISKIGSFSHTIEADLHFECQANAYLTPPGSQAFPAHFDDHDVIVAQIHGTKRWSVYGSLIVDSARFALREEIDPATLPEPSCIELQPGDALYIPRGMVHSAQAQENSSVHLTFGIHAPTIKGLLIETLNALSLRDGRLNERLPARIFEDRAARAQVLEMVSAVVTLLGEQESIGDGIGSLQDNLVRRGRCHARGQLVDCAAYAASINTETRLVRYSPLYSRVMAMADGVGLQFGQSLVEAPERHRDAFLFVSKASREFKVGELPGIDTAEQIEIARKLVTSGFLISANAQRA
jgi:hypothetical protein